jgi:hypothetical protein
MLPRRQAEVCQLCANQVFRSPFTLFYPGSKILNLCGCRWTHQYAFSASLYVSDAANHMLFVKQIARDEFVEYHHAANDTGRLINGTSSR